MSYSEAAIYFFIYLAKSKNTNINILMSRRCVHSKFKWMGRGKQQTLQTAWDKITHIYQNYLMGPLNIRYKDFLMFYFNFFNFIQLQFSAFSSHPSTPPQPIPPPSLTSTLPLDFVLVSFIVVPVDPSPHYPLPSPLWLLLHCS